MTPFDFLKLIHNDKKIKWEDFNEDEQKSWNTFIINKGLSFNSDYLNIINNIQRYTPTNKESFRYLQSMTKNYFKYNKWIKGSKSTKFNKDLIEIISAYLECSHREAEDYLNILDIKEIKQFLKVIGIQDSEVKKLMKK